MNHAASEMILAGSQNPVEGIVGLVIVALLVLFIFSLVSYLLDGSRSSGFAGVRGFPVRIVWKRSQR